jgi:TRAP transporter TAXI family solute receptor
VPFWNELIDLARKAGPWALALIVCGFLFAIVLTPRTPAPQQQVRRASFEIATAADAASNIRVAAMMAGLLSNPPGIGRCARPELCGPPGLIVTARAARGATANLLAVETGTVDSAISEGHMVARAVAGQGPFRTQGRAQNLRMLANLYGEDIHIVAARRAGILSVGDLRNKRVSLSPEGSATIEAARAVLRAYRLAEWRLVRNHDPVDRAALLLREGEIDAFFMVGAAPTNVVTQLLEDDIAVLIPIDDEGRTQLLAAEKHMVARTIPLDMYPGSPSVETVGVYAVWVTHASKPDTVIHPMVRALYEPGNRPLIARQHTGFEFFERASAAVNPAAPLHPAAERFFSDTMPALGGQ